MSVIDQARRELAAINFGEEDTAVMIDIMERFFDQWDSGGAVAVVVPLLQRLLAGKPLTPLTGEDDEWVDSRPRPWRTRHVPKPPLQHRLQGWRGSLRHRRAGAPADHVSLLARSRRGAAAHDASLIPPPVG